MSTVDTVARRASVVSVHRHTVGRAHHALDQRIALTVLLMSGLTFSARIPALYWDSRLIRNTAAPGDRAMEDADNVTGRDAHSRPRFDTTGAVRCLARCQRRDRRGDVPVVAHDPGNRWLSLARNWHFLLPWIFVVNGLCYVLYAIWSRHLARDLAPTGTDWRSIGRSIVDHLRFIIRWQAQAYNVLQTNLSDVIFVLLPLVILMGFAMSPGLDSVHSGLGSRSSAAANGADNPFCHRLGCWSIRVRPRLRGHHHRTMEQSSFDDTGRYRVEARLAITRDVSPRRRFLLAALSGAGALCWPLRQARQYRLVQKTLDAGEIAHPGRQTSRDRAGRWRRNSARRPLAAVSQHGTRCRAAHSTSAGNGRFAAYRLDIGGLVSGRPACRLPRCVRCRSNADNAHDCV